MPTRSPGRPINYLPPRDYRLVKMDDWLVWQIVVPLIALILLPVFTIGSMEEPPDMWTSITHSVIRGDLILWAALLVFGVATTYKNLLFYSSRSETVGDNRMMQVSLSLGIALLLAYVSFGPARNWICGSEADTDQVTVTSILSTVLLSVSGLIWSIRALRRLVH